MKLRLGCSYLGFEIDPEQARASNERLGAVTTSSRQKMDGE